MSLAPVPGKAFFCVLWEEKAIELGVVTAGKGWEQDTLSSGRKGLLLREPMQAAERVLQDAGAEGWAWHTFLSCEGARSWLGWVG